MWPANYKIAAAVEVAKTPREINIECKKDSTDASQGLHFRQKYDVDTEATASLVTATTMFPMAQKTSTTPATTEATTTIIKQRKRLDISKDQHYLHNPTTESSKTREENNSAKASYTHYSEVRSKNAGVRADVGSKVATSESATTTRTNNTRATISTSDSTSSTSSPHLYCTTSKTHSSRNIQTMATPLYAWLLVLLCLIAYFGFVQAGFACLSNPCVFGVCIDGLNSSYSCYCIDGYTGIQCQTNWDECWSGPCQNGGTCVDGVAYYNCTCPVGFTGVNCQENVDECMSNPCQNGGHCRDRTNGYTCTCQAGYMGEHCEIDVAVCDTDSGTRCLNGGVCIEGPGLEFSCDCAAGWKGHTCEEEINECESAPCQNGGVCVDKLAAYVCACPMGYTGTNCEEEILICADNPCQNNALCLMEESVPTCYCVPDYHGEKCEYQYDECQLGPRCMNGGVCIDGVDTFSCSCPPLLTGMLCECLMLNDDNLNCNYTAPPTSAPTFTQRPITSSTPVITSVTTVHTSSAETETVEETAREIPLVTTTTVSSASVEDVGSAPQTTEASISYSEESHISSEASYSSESSSGVTSAEVDLEQYTTIGKQEMSVESLEGTTSTVKPMVEEESEENNFIAYATKATIHQHVTTIDTSVSIEFSTPKPLWTPTPTVSTNEHGLKHPTETAEDTEEEEEISNTFTTTAATVFFTEYPEVIVGTHMHDLQGKDLTIDMGSGAVHVTTHKPLTTTTTSTTYLIDSESIESTTIPISTTSLNETTHIHQHHHHHHPHHHEVVQPSTHKPYYQQTTPTITTTTTLAHVTFPPLQPASTELPTVAPMSTEELVSPASPTFAPTEPIMETTTQKKSTFTEAVAAAAATPTLAPSYSTDVPKVFTRPPTSPALTFASSEENEGANTVAIGSGPTLPAPATVPPHIPIGVNGSSTDCLKQGCYNGGTCVTTSEGSRCVCRFDRQGSLCEQTISIKNAAFSGDSYVSHHIHKDIPRHESLDAVLPMHVQLKVRTRATNGLIMLAAAQGTKGGHYMALFLQKGLLQFQFSCGLQTMLLSELETPVNTGHEITIRAELDFSRNYTHCNASLLVNDTLAMSGDQPTWLKLLPPRLYTPDAILNTWLHLGGAPQAPIGLIIELPPAQSGTGFTGCLHSLRINGETREIFGDALDGFGITECGSLACLSSPCRNGAACIKIETNEVDENGDKAEKWKCKCPTGYMGPTCEISVCEDNPCQYGGTCVQFPGSGYLCLCPLGKHGHYCEHNLEVALPSFSGSVNGLSSFVAYTVPIPLEYSIELSFKILPQTMSQIALLAFLGQSGYHDEKSDHLAISFIQGYIMLTWNLGAGPRRIFTQKPIDFRLDAPRVPYEIKVGRIGRQAWLSVDGKYNITGRSPGSVSRMDVLPILYLGGHEIANFNTLPHDLPLHSGFQGCIYDVNLKAGQVTVPLQETRGVRGRGVGQCGTRECHRHACQHDGACLQHGATFTCICQEGWYGPLCAQSINPCDSFNNKCSEDSTCVPLVNGYECDCPVGRTGKNCEEEIRSLSDVSLTGRRSYLAVRWPYVFDNSDKLGSKRSQMISYRNFTKKLMPLKPAAPMPNQHFVMKLLNEVEKQRSFSPVPLMGSKSFEEHHRVQFFFIEFQLRPLSERGLLLYFGSLNTNQDKKGGFVSLSLQGGVVEFRISAPNNHVTVVRSVRMLAIGEWHKIKMAQRGRWLTLWVEGSASSALAPSAEVLLEPDSLLYIGGLKDLSKLPHNAISGFPIPFRGCVRGLVVSGTRIVLNESNIVESRNIRDCDGTACGGDSCESGGHCWLDEKLQPHCICPEYAKGERCEYSETCKLIPCKNNGRCLRSGRCSCPNGWGGFYCEIAMSKPTTPSFRGNSYLVLPPPRIPVKDKRKGPSLYMRPRESLQISLNFSTINPDGLLLWSEHENSKFLGLGLENGHLKLASNLLGTNNGTVAAPASGFIAEGSWHFVKVILDRSRLELQLDGEVIFTEKFADNLPQLDNTTTTITTTTKQQNWRNGNNNTRRNNKDASITYEDVFYLGGFPKLESVRKRTQARFTEPFRGCLQDIQFGVESNTVITDFSGYQGENIGSCDLHGDEPYVI